VDPRVGDTIHYREEGRGAVLEVRVTRIDDDGMVWYSLDGQERGLSIANWRRAAPRWTLH